MAQANEAEIRKAFATVFGSNVKISAIRKIEAMGLYEVQIGSSILRVSGIRD
jgi:hypothetical protein